MKKTAVVVTSLVLASSVAFAQSISISPSGTVKIAPDNASGSKGQETAPGQMKKEYGVTEDLKVKDPMKWVGIMNNIRHSAKEIVLTEIVYA